MAKDTPRHVWMVRAGNDNQLAPLVEAKKAVAIGWYEMGNLAGLKTREDFKGRYLETYGQESPFRVNSNSAQVYRFARDIHLNDYVLTFNKASREYLIGVISSEMLNESSLFSEGYPNIRRVKWLRRVSRDLFSEGARNSLGSALTVFQIDEHLAEISRLASGGMDEPSPPDDVPEIPFHEDVKSKADERIADLITQLAPYDFQDLVAALLRAMGFRAQSSPKGRDKGVDVVAYPDALGFGKPRIKVQVKHRSSSAGGPDLRNFIAALDQEDNGLFISTGGFAGDATLEKARARATLTLLDRDGFIELLLEHYDKLEPEYQAMLPLRKVWVPTN